jgi:hypothetical protein
LAPCPPGNERIAQSPNAKGLKTYGPFPYIGLSRPTGRAMACRASVAETLAVAHPALASLPAPVLRATLAAPAGIPSIGSLGGA